MCLCFCLYFLRVLNTFPCVCMSVQYDYMDLFDLCMYTYTYVYTHVICLCIYTARDIWTEYALCITHSITDITHIVSYYRSSW